MPVAWLMKYCCLACPRPITRTHLHFPYECCAQQKDVVVQLIVTAKQKWLFKIVLLSDTYLPR